MTYTAIYTPSGGGFSVTIMGEPGGQQCEAWGKNMEEARASINERLAVCLRKTGTARFANILEVMSKRSLRTSVRTPKTPPKTPMAAPPPTVVAANGFSQLKDDQMISTLRQLVEALGGELEIAATFGKRRYQIA